MNNADHDRMAEEIDRLRQALEAEARNCLDIQRQLVRANAEFEEFVSTSAHDMRQSLRGVASYSQLLAETCSGRLDADANASLGHIQEETAKMQSLLTGIVDYWAAGARDRDLAPTDMDAVLAQALLFKDKLIAERGAIVTHDPLPAVMGDFATLTKVLRHLMRNAIEYCATPPPRIHVSAKREDTDWVFSVADNGPGIDPAFHNRIFGVFKRLHGKDYPGNGLGLAFCKKTVEWLGGRIWVESTPGAGSTFYFTLPPAD